MPQSVSIVGAGVIGLSCAYRLAKSGYKVRVYHHAPVGTGASGQAAGALKPFDALQTGWKQKLQQQSLWKYLKFLSEVESESGICVDFQRCGRVAVYDNPSSLEKAKKAAEKANQDWPFSPAQTILTRQDLLTYAPDVEPDACGGVFCHATGVLNPQKLLLALEACCINLGVEFLLKSLGALPQERPLLVSAGAFTQKLLPTMPIKPIKRQAILLKWPYRQPLEHITENGQVYLVPKLGGQQVYVGSTFEPEAGFDNTPTPQAEHDLRTHASRLFPALQTATLLERFSGLQSRGYGEGSTLKLGRVAQIPGVYVAAGHGGVGYCMAPATAQEIQRLIEADFLA